MSYSEDLRMKVIEYLEKGHTQREASVVFSINLSTINSWSQKYKKTGEVKDIKRQYTHKKLDPEKLKMHIAEHPDAYLKEIGNAFGCTDMAVHKALRKLGITRKKRPSGIVSKIPKK